MSTVSAPLSLKDGSCKEILPLTHTAWSREGLPGETLLMRKFAAQGYYSLEADEAAVNHPTS